MNDQVTKKLDEIIQNHIFELLDSDRIEQIKLDFLEIIRTQHLDAVINYVYWGLNNDVSFNGSYSENGKPKHFNISISPLTND